MLVGQLCQGLSKSQYELHLNKLKDHLTKNKHHVIDLPHLHT